MSSANPSQLLLLADHIKLSLLERQRAITLNLEPNAQDGQISRSLDSLRSGIEAIESQLEQNPDDDTSDTSDQLASLKSQFSDLQTQFHGFANAPSDILTSPNEPSLAADFVAAQRKPTQASKSASKSVRFRDSPPASPDQNREALFPSRYRDDPEDNGPPDQSDLTNDQIHQYHTQVLRDQDDQLDQLGISISRQRELSMQIGDELDSHALLLEDVEEGVDRHQNQLNRARTRLDRFSRKARENWSLTVIVVLIIILLLLIIILK